MWHRGALHREMAKGGYNGGRTVISAAKNPNWFGSAGVNIPREQREAELREELNRNRKAEGSKWSEVESHLRKALQERRDAEAIEALIDLPGQAIEKTILDEAIERRLYELKRDIRAYAGKARSALDVHEQLRQDLVQLLAKHRLPETAYPEARKFKL